MVANQIKRELVFGFAVALFALVLSTPVGMANEVDRWKIVAVPSESVKTPIQGNYALYAPLVFVAREGISVHPQNRSESIAFFQTYYNLATESPIEWTGNYGQCNAGTVSASFRDAIAQRINYFRAMAGVPAVVKLSDDYSAKAQQAALMMSVNRRLSHSPEPHWTCYTASGDEAAGSSNLYLGVYGVDAITGYIRDEGGGNYPVGHRRWLLYPQTRLMGSGDVPERDGYPAANALWLFDENLFETRPETRDEFVAWPPPGYVPYQVVFPRWSFSYPGADFSAATVSIVIEGQPVTVAVQPVVNGFGENTLTWEPNVANGMPPASDLRYTVTLQNVKIAEGYRNFSYDVIIINPES